MTHDTIFSPAFGNRPSYLVGRERIIQQFIDGFQTEPGNRDRAVVMLGQRGSGKTVLLWELADRASSLGFAVATPTVTAEGMLERIVEKIQESGAQYVKTPATHVSGESIGAMGFTVGLEFTHEAQGKSFAYKLTQLARALTDRGHGLLILIDELQANSPDIRQIVTVYQELVGERLNVAMVLAGLPGAVSATLNDKVLTFLNRARKVNLPPLAFSDVDAFYERAFRQLGVALTPEARRRAAEETQGSPYLLQLIGHNIALRAPNGEELTEESLQSAFTAARLDFENDVCGTTLAALSEKDVEFLEAMALDEGPSAIADVADRMGVTKDYAQKYRRRLIDAGVIEAAGRGRVSFAVPYLADYLRRDWA